MSGVLSFKLRDIGIQDKASQYQNQLQSAVSVFLRDRSFWTVALRS
jgi:hypothetical protein